MAMVAGRQSGNIDSRYSWHTDGTVRLSIFMLYDSCSHQPLSNLSCRRSVQTPVTPLCYNRTYVVFVNPYKDKTLLLGL